MYLQKEKGLDLARISNKWRRNLEFAILSLPLLSCWGLLE